MKRGARRNRMIISIRSGALAEERAQIMNLLHRITSGRYPIALTEIAGRELIVLGGNEFYPQANAALRLSAAVEQIIPIETPYQLVSREFQAESSSVVVGKEHACIPVTIGWPASPPVIIAGPCAVESREQVLSTAHAVKAAGAHVLRGGAFKPRTSPYQFQGLGLEGLQLLAEARAVTGLPVITEVMEPGMVETVAEHADVLQIGSRNMQNYPLLAAAGHHAHKRPVLLKRGVAATIDEWLLAAEYIVAAGNPNVMLCERGIRGYDQHTRNVLDLTAVPLLSKLTHLPVIIDPSHATGHSELVPAMSCAGIAAGAAGLIIEVHPDPDAALCDGHQSITPAVLRAIVGRATRINDALGSAYEEEALSLR
jgi:3-deoxy-7-phosphoheptulonate synthase